ncbi:MULTISPECIES: diacylglycerol kinase family protein [unclassified Leeuwenhoekiella]|uniref:diacylglycerol/lipid kinase family protein n=1 Tax=unclassified Leeuwenhoekiella TaxID=2615029 RepID=UPI000C56AAC2|nr:MULTISPECIES: diacylglycerol kinase family protein [unclassified Leeuwenhoekiella]MAW94707.1 diacylglycerol kinase [Leeuwenhoekiella sp.]MAW95482.1 diacylglycerol kinase [Leeuwenhoekiella sp.]MBA82130.1 diacylglycerol kinase [Leeuwenhoekiella sp.]|tara:strand:- start:637 stop:1527 length:891 start_codon:yes stop_codon:yes gene_type:complete
MKTQKTILLVINPIAGGTDKKPIIERFKTFVSEKDYAAEVYETTGEDDQKAIDELVDRINPERVFISGGDGTIREVADVLKEKEVKIALLPSGSANGLAENLDLPEDLEEQFTIGMADHFIALDTLDVNGHTCLHISDIGVNAQLIKNYEQSEIRGKFGYLLQAFPTLVNNKFPFKVTLKVNGETLEKEGILVAIANANKFGTGANINPKGKMNDRKFEVLVFKNFSITEILKTFYGSSNLDHNFVEAFCCDEVEIETGEPIALQVDGEYLGDETRIRAQMNLHKINIAVPSDFKL